MRDLKGGLGKFTLAQNISPCSPAEVGIVHEQPVTCLQGLNQHTIQPLKSSISPTILQLSETLLKQCEVHLQFGHI